MPKEHKQRGRREGKKRKRQEDDLSVTLKRLKSEDIDIRSDGNEDHRSDGPDANVPSIEIPFYGLLDEGEQEYFKRADSMLELDQFNDAEERTLFVNNVYQEARGKELKIVNSQSCSRLMERLIMMSTADQLKSLFQKLSGHFLHLAQHRFASHCCETLFLQCAPLVTQELLAPLRGEQQVSIEGEIFVTMENLFLYTLNELENNLGFLITDPFASHTLRVLLLVLSGRPLADVNTTALLQSKKKENVSMLVGTLSISEMRTMSRTVPESFGLAVEKIIFRSVAGLDTTYLRALATHPVANPVLQFLLVLELSSSGKQKAKDPRSLFRKLIPEDSPELDSSTTSFINNLAYDTVGSRLLEAIIKHAPGKSFKMLYGTIFGDKIGILAKNDVAGFIVIKFLERLSKEDLHSATEQIGPFIGFLLQRSRTSIIKTLIERCRIRDVDVQPISDAIVQAYGSNASHRLMEMLRLDTSNTDGMAEDRKRQVEKQDAAKVHGSLLAQTMLDTPGVLRGLITDGLLTMDITTLIIVAKDRSASRMLQCSLAVSEESLKYRRVLVQRFFGHITELATDTIASHVVDEFWTASKGLKFIREQIAAELFKNEAIIRDSFSGRAVWKNWKMDIYKTKRRDWMFGAKEAGDSKTGLELARERFASTARIKGQNIESRLKKSTSSRANDNTVGS